MTCLKNSLYLVIFLSGCANNGTSLKRGESDPIVLERIIPDTTNNILAQIELEHFQVKKLLCKELGIYDAGNSKDSIELRIWDEPSMWEPHELYIIKGTDSSWKAIRYIFYQRHNNYETEDYKYWDADKEPIIDSIEAKSVFPQKMTWKNYIANLQIDSLWKFPSQSEIKGDYGCVDGIGYTIELKDKRRYKAFRYHCPRGRNELNHIRFAELIDKIKAPLSYKGMHAAF